jgi:hypothetical protein
MVYPRLPCAGVPKKKLDFEIEAVAKSEFLNPIHFPTFPPQVDRITYILLGSFEKWLWKVGLR